MLRSVLFGVVILIGGAVAAAFLTEAAFTGRAVMLQGQMQTMLAAGKDDLAGLLREAHLADDASVRGKRFAFETYMTSQAMDPRRAVTFTFDLAGTGAIARFAAPGDDSKSGEASALSGFAERECGRLVAEIAERCIVAAATSDIKDSPSGMPRERITVKLIFQEKPPAGGVPEYPGNTFYTETVSNRSRILSAKGFDTLRTETYRALAGKCDRSAAVPACSLLDVRFGVTESPDGSFSIDSGGTIGRLLPSQASAPGQ
jgi:hypothetical protein